MSNHLDQSLMLLAEQRARRQAELDALPRIWVVTEYEPYEQYTSILGAFATEASARACVEASKYNYPCDIHEVALEP